MKTVILLFFIYTTLNIGQELHCTVTTNYEALPVVNRERLIDFAEVVENYLNNTTFTSENFDGEKIECTLSIYFTGASSDVNYSAQLFVGTRRPVYKSQKNSPMFTILDNNWNFVYEKGQSIYQSQSVYDPITSFLDFYAFIIIAYDMDSFEELSGTKYYSKAFDIVNLGEVSKFSAGWQKTTGSYSRRGLVEDLMNEKYREFREAFFNYHYNGIDLYTTKKAEAQKNIAALITTLEAMKSKININSILIKTFFDAKHGEIIEYLADYPDREILRKLIKIDPPHASKYEEALNSN